MNKVYLITYNTAINFNKSVFHSYVNNLFKGGFISDWWHYIDNTYLVATALDINQLYNYIHHGVPQQYLLIVEIDTKNAQGWLPKDGWAWLSKYSR